jgi:hypothetical protein
MARYPGTPLAKKLGIKSGFVIKLVNAPPNYLSLFTDWPDGVKQINDSTIPKDFIHYFAVDTGSLNKDLKNLKSELKPAGMLWISWAKRASKISTDVTEDTIRHLGLKYGLVDIKVCAIDQIWSALKFVIAIKDRK